MSDRALGSPIAGAIRVQAGYAASMSNRSGVDPASLVRRAVQVEVALLRTPLLLADRVATRLGAQAAVRPKVQQGLVLLDALADRVAADLPSGPAPSTSTAPAPSPRPSEDEAGDAAEDEDEDEAELIEEVTEELLNEQELAPRAGELADDEELRRVQAELNAKRLVEEQQEQRPDGRSE